MTATVFYSTWEAYWWGLITGGVWAALLWTPISNFRAWVLAPARDPRPYDWETEGL
jgi:hypothetical protein